MSVDTQSESIWSLAVHGGAGQGREQEANIEHADAIRAELAAVLEKGAAILRNGGTAVDAVEDAVRRLEDSPLFNAGRGSVFNAAGEHELEASIMDGRTLDAGAAAALRGIKNPVSLARLVMQRSPHVFLQGEGAIAFAKAQGMELVDEAYFSTEDRRAALELAKRRSPPPNPSKQGTVGAVARDVHGDLAAATSTGGMTNKAVGRIGDSPIIGAGCYASNASCAVSGTGQGEYFIRATVARDIAALMEYGGKNARAAAAHVIRRRLEVLGGEGGVVVVDRDGHIVFEFNTGVMLRASVTHAAPVRTGIDRRDALY
jgi:L-asparaginase / beta-aspartyl-peptidase